MSTWLHPSPGDLLDPGIKPGSPALQADFLPTELSAKLTELIALTRALEMGKGKIIAIYTDSKYAFLVLHAHAAI